MKRPLALVLTLALLLAAFAGCMKKNAGNGDQADGAPAMTDAQAEALYAPLIEQYRDAIANFSFDNYDLDIVYLTIDYYHYGAAAGYTIFDVNRDGTPELIIGEQDSDEKEKMRTEFLGGIYTLHDGKPKYLLGSVDESSSVSVLKDGRIVENSVYWGRLGEGMFSTVLALKNGDLAVEKTYFSAGEYDEASGDYGPFKYYIADKAIFRGDDGEPDLDGLQPIDKSEYDVASAALSEEQMTFPITLFAADAESEN